MKLSKKPGKIQGILQNFLGNKKNGFKALAVFLHYTYAVGILTINTSSVNNINNDLCYYIKLLFQQNIMIPKSG